MKRILSAMSLLVGLLSVWTTQAQTMNLLAFVNSGGQVVITSADESYRWIVTPPNQALTATPALAWSPDGRWLLYATPAQLHLADTATQTILTADVGGTISQLQWANQADSFTLTHSERVWLGNVREGIINLLPLANGSLPVDGLAPQADALMLIQNGVFQTLNVNTAQLIPSALAVNPYLIPNAVYWADRSAWVAYAGVSVNQTSAFAVSHIMTGETWMLDSGTSLPVTPLGWQPRGSLLFYRDISGIRVADVGCLENGCGGNNPLLSGQPLLPTNVTSLMIGTQNLAYVEGGQVRLCPSLTDCSQPLELGALQAGQALLASEDHGAFTGTDGLIVRFDLNCGALCGAISTGASGVLYALAGDGRSIVSGGNGSLQIVQDGRYGASLSVPTHSITLAWNQ